MPLASSEPAYKQVADSIRRSILDGTLEPGHRLPVEPDLAEHHGVSRSTIREALRSLASEHLVVTLRGVGGGTFVTHPEPEHISQSFVTTLGLLTSTDEISVSELLEARELLEVPACGLAAQRRTAQQLAEIKELLETGPRDSFGFENRKDFHLVIVGCTRNQLLALMTEPLFAVLQNRFLRDRAPAKFWERVGVEHRAIYAAIAAGDRVTAEYEMREHLHHLRQTYEQIDRRELR